MARLTNNLVVYDFETDSKDPNTAQPIQIAAVVINPFKMDYFRNTDGSHVYFNSLMRPDLDTFDESSTSIHKKTKEMLADAPLPEQVWKDFHNFVRQFNTNGKTDDWNSPVSVGFNNDKYDMVIVQRLCKQYKMLRADGKQNLFKDFQSFDVLKMAQSWFWWSKEPHSLSLDNLRKFFGMSKQRQEQAHDALPDVIDTGDIFIKFMRLYEKLGATVKFVDCFGENPRKIGDKTD